MIEHAGLDWYEMNGNYHSDTRDDEPNYYIRKKGEGRWWGEVTFYDHLMNFSARTDGDFSSPEEALQNLIDRYDDILSALKE